MKIISLLNILVNPKKWACLITIMVLSGMFGVGIDKDVRAASHQQDLPPSPPATSAIRLLPAVTGTAVPTKPSATVVKRGLGMGPFPGVPLNFLGETAKTNRYEILLNKASITAQMLQIEVYLINNTENPINLFSSLQLFNSNDQAFTASNISTEPTTRGSNSPHVDSEPTLAPHSSTNVVLKYMLSSDIQSEDLPKYQLVYMPLGYSGEIFVHYLVTRPIQGELRATTPRPREAVPQAVYGTTGDPWKMLVLIYQNIDTDYVDLDGTKKHLNASMPLQDITNVKKVFLNLPHRNIVYDYSGQTAEIEANIVIVNRPLTSLEKINNGYWISPDITRQELDLYAPKGKYDSVIAFWQASHPTTGQSIPDGGGWGWGYWPGGTFANGMTYASVHNLSWVWTTSNQACHGEVFLHEWLHGVTGFYLSKGVLFNLNDLHGAVEAGYGGDFQDGCWDSWLKDYMRGLVYENGQRKALVPELSWHKGSITTWTIQGWRGEYFNNETLSDTIPIMVFDDSAINFDWLDSSPHPLITPDHFSVRWTKTQIYNAGLYNFSIIKDDGMRVWVDDHLIIDKWIHGREEFNVNYDLSAGQHTIRVEYYDIDSLASAKLTIQESQCYELTTLVSPSTGGNLTIVPPPNCGSKYAVGTSVTLTANPISTYSFTNWSGDLTGVTNSETITMNADKTITANFIANIISKMGDVNCDSIADLADSLYILQYDAGTRKYGNTCPPAADALYLPACDVNKDNICDLADGLLILQCDTGIKNSFCLP